MSNELHPYNKAYSLRPSLIARTAISYRSTGNYKVYGMGLGFAEMFHQK